MLSHSSQSVTRNHTLEEDPCRVQWITFLKSDIFESDLTRFLHFAFRGANVFFGIWPERRLPLEAAGATSAEFAPSLNLHHDFMNRFPTIPRNFNSYASWHLENRQNIPGKTGNKHFPKKYTLVIVMKPYRRPTRAQAFFLSSIVFLLLFLSTHFLITY